MSYPLLEIKDAVKHYGGSLWSGQRPVAALQGCSLSVHGTPASITAIAGESGSGKSTLASAVLGFVTLDSGQVRFMGQDLATMDRHLRFNYRRQVQAVFQDPYAAFNPFYRAGHLFDLALRHFKLAASHQEAKDRIADALHRVGLSTADLKKHPHQLSGGQRQRMMVARACLIEPKLIVADEPVSMVDASLRSMILDIMLRLRDESAISFLYITHDLSTAYQIADDIHILFRGTVVESGPTAEVLGQPRHPYTRTLIESIPAPDPARRWNAPLTTDWENEHTEPSTDCCFRSRCPEAAEGCPHGIPGLSPISEGSSHQVACWRANTQR